jgi:hypothetical protein
VTSRLILRPRSTRRGDRYDVEYLGELIVIGSADPEHAAARALVNRGIGGSAETIDGATGEVRMRFAIERFAGTRTVERNSGGLATEPWRRMPPEISHGGSEARDSGPRERKIAGSTAKTSLTERGRRAA